MLSCWGLDGPLGSWSINAAKLCQPKTGKIIAKNHSRIYAETQWAITKLLRAKLLGSPFALLQWRRKELRQLLLQKGNLYWYKKVHLYGQKDPGKTTTFLVSVWHMHLSTKKQWSPYPRVLTAYLRQDEVCKDANFPQFNTVFRSSCVYTFEIQVRAKQQMQKEVTIWSFLARALHCFSAVTVYLQK